MHNKNNKSFQDANSFLLKGKSFHLARFWTIKVFFSDN